MKKTFFTIIFLCLTAMLAAQTKSQRLIYLWDVTRSMNGKKGVNGMEVDDPNGINIYSDVVKFLEQEISSITDASTEIVVLPFKESVLETWKETADESGKKTIIQKIKNYNNEGLTGTNIVRPIHYVQKKIISNDKNNLLVILTDGKQSEDFGGNSELLNVIRDWQVYSKIHDAYALYVMLTKEAEDSEVIKTIEDTENIDVVTEPGQKQFIFLTPAENISANIKDNKTANIALTSNTSVPLPENIKVKVTSTDSILSINQIVTVENKEIVFDLKYSQPYETLKTQLAEKTLVPLKIELTNQSELPDIVQLTSENINLELINKPEKTINPLALLLFWLAASIATILLACYIIAHFFVNPSTKFSKIFIDYNDGAGEQRINMGGAYKLLCTNKKTKFSIFSKFFVGTVKVEVNEFWTHPVTIGSGMRDNVRVSGLGSFELNTAETVRKEPFSITNDSGKTITITTA
ncbi:MAG: VWA domain-containing protein [Lentimicrobiaceae bacterium]|jgi:hypothetical protein|nr:VWA domain-containing protein [Lentimicrobiaceae bacterium]